MNRKASYNEGWQTQCREGLTKTKHIAVENKTTPFATSHVISSYKEHATKQLLSKSKQYNLDISGIVLVLYKNIASGPIKISSYIYTYITVKTKFLLSKLFGYYNRMTLLPMLIHMLVAHFVHGRLVKFTQVSAPTA